MTTEVTVDDIAAANAYITHTEEEDRLMKVFAGTIALATFVLTGCATTATTPADAEAFVRAQAAPFQEAFNSAAWDSVARFYTEDAVVLPPNADAARGPAIIEMFRSLGAMRPHLTFSADRVVQSCDLAYEYGTYQMQLNPPGGAMVNDRGKFLAVWRRMPDGTWKMAADMFNTSLPEQGR